MNKQIKYDACHIHALQTQIDFLKSRNDELKLKQHDEFIKQNHDAICDAFDDEFDIDEFENRIDNI